MVWTEEHWVPGADASEVPFAIKDPAFISKERYFSPEFYELEKERLWPRVWQLACRTDEIPRAGDFVEYVICDQSILVVRQRDESIKAFQNACRHRATQLAVGSGSLPGGRIVCPFHGWTYDIDGTNTFVYGAEAFAPECLRPDDISLREVNVDVWEELVFVNMMDDPEPLLEALSPMTQELSAIPISKLKVRWWRGIELQANWKMAMEAFEEGWHSAQTHPQLTLGSGLGFNPNFTATDAYENGHAFLRTVPEAFGLFCEASGLTIEEAVIGWSRVICDGLDSLIIRRDMDIIEGLANKPIPAGSDLPTEVAKALYDYAQGAGIEMPVPDEKFAGLWGSDAFVFPNFLVLPYFGNALMYRFRPLGPESCFFEIFALTLPAEHEDFGRPRLEGVFAADDKNAWPLVFEQDFSNIERQQRGLHSRGFGGSKLAIKNEQPVIANMHAELDRYLARP